MKFTKPLLITKLKATGVHLSISVVIFAYLTYKIVFDWYPSPYFSVDGGWQGIRLVGAVDLVLGPLITFLIFDNRKSKREILFDLMVIASIQIGALAYGVHTTYAQRPVAVVMFDEFMVSVIREQYADSWTSEATLSAYSDEHPPIIFSDLPQTREGLEKVDRVQREQRIISYAQMEYYQPADAFQAALEARQPLFADRLAAYNHGERYHGWLERSGNSPGSVLIAPFSGRYGLVWLVFDRNGKYIDYF